MYPRTISCSVMFGHHPIVAKKEWGASCFAQVPWELQKLLSYEFWISFEIATNFLIKTNTEELKKFLVRALWHQQLRGCDDREEKTKKDCECY